MSKTGKDFRKGIILTPEQKEAFNAKTPNMQPIERR